jgi:hypothetical protein
MYPSKSGSFTGANLESNHKGTFVHDADLTKLPLQFFGLISVYHTMFVLIIMYSLTMFFLGIQLVQLAYIWREYNGAPTF